MRFIHTFALVNRTSINISVLTIMFIVALVVTSAAYVQLAPVKPPALAAGLSGYTLRQMPMILEGVEANASDLIYSPETETLLLITNAPTAIHELSLEGKPLRRISLEGFNDTEGITHVRGSLFAITEERNRTLALIHITPETRQLARSEATLIPLEAEAGDNKGPEGITYDPDHDKFLLVKEKSPRGIYHVSMSSPASRAPLVTFEKIGFWKWLNMTDLSAIHYHLASKSIYFLSDESQRLEERSLDGELLSHLSLREGASGLAASIPQAEGFAMTPDGTIYICSEPNLLFIFAKTTES